MRVLPALPSWPCKNGDYALAVDYAQRAAQAAPNEAQLWFLLGYTARLDGKSQLSADAYNQGLRLNPSVARRALRTRADLQHHGPDDGGRAVF